MKTSALISAALVAALLSMGPFAPVITVAQAQMQPVQPKKVFRKMRRGVGGVGIIVISRIVRA